MGGPSGTTPAAPDDDTAGLPAAIESGFRVPAGVPGVVGAASESWCALFCTRRIESRIARWARTTESCRTESRCERCLTALSCLIVDGVVSCDLAIDVWGGRIESDCARSPQDIRSKRNTM